MALIIGTERSNHSLSGTPGDDEIHGLGGNDFISGLAGRGLLNGGTDNDRLGGGPGADTSRGGSSDKGPRRRSAAGKHGGSDGDRRQPVAG